MKTVSKIINFPLTTTSYVNVTITKKRMKNMRLSISKNAQVKVSIPSYTAYSYAYQFLVRKREWIISQVNKINANLLRDSCNFVDNGNIFLLGHNFPLKVELDTKNKVIFNNSSKLNNINQNAHFNEVNNTTLKPNPTSTTNIPNTNANMNTNLNANTKINTDTNLNYGFIIYVKENMDVKNVFIKWCKKYFLDFFSNRLNYMYSQIFKNNTPPSIKIKTMKSMWGNCNFVKNIITLNLYLAKTPLECIDYVIVHELAHLIYHNHSKDFHNLMTTLMPDWKARKKILNNYSLNF